MALNGLKMLINMDTMKIFDLILSRVRFLKDLTLILRLVRRCIAFLPLSIFVLQSTLMYYLRASSEIRLASARSATIEEDVASISGRPFSDSGSSKVSSSAHFIFPSLFLILWFLLSMPCFFFLNYFCL